jgi:Family of unknown function (DUF6156)
MSALRYFLTYSGVKLPLRLVNPLGESELGHRNTYIRARYDDQDRLIECEKLVYGEVELTHRYRYHANGALRSAEIILDGDSSVMEFDAEGHVVDV